MTETVRPIEAKKFGGLKEQGAGFENKNLDLSTKSQDNVIAHELAHALFAMNTTGMKVEEINFVGDGVNNSGYVKVETNKDVDPVMLGALALASIAIQKVLPGYKAMGTSQDEAQAKNIEAQTGVSYDRMMGLAVVVLSKIGSERIRAMINKFKTYESISPAMLALA